MTPLFFLFDISPETACLVVAFWAILFFVLAVIKNAGKKGYQKKHQHEWTHEDWQEYLEDEQKHLDDISRR